MYSVKVEFVLGDRYDRNRLVITDDTGEREQWDGGEPEDNSFIRDWAWVRAELLSAYETGKRDGRLEPRTIREAEFQDRIRKLEAANTRDPKSIALKVIQFLDAEVSDTEMESLIAIIEW
jgi:hypothetical protein